MTRPLRALLLGSLLALGLLLPATGSMAAGVQIYPAKLHVAGGLTITTTHDALVSCSPGQAWTLEEKIDVELSKTVKIERNGDKLLKSTDARQPGGAVNSNVLAAYTESNYCAPEDPVTLKRPDCATFSGTLAASLQPDPRHRKPWQVSIGMTRTTGGTQSISCLGSPILAPTPVGTKIDALQTTYGAIVLPLNLTVNSFRTLGKGRKLIRTVNVGGSCDGPIAYGGSHISTVALLAKPDECAVVGVFNVEIKRLK
jgi:hypothetical protein